MPELKRPPIKMFAVWDKVAKEWLFACRQGWRGRAGTPRLYRDRYEIVEVVALEAPHNGV